MENYSRQIDVIEIRSPSSSSSQVVKSTKTQQRLEVELQDQEQKQKQKEEQEQEQDFFEALEESDRGWKRYFNLTTVSNFMTFFVMVVGLVLELFITNSDGSCGKQCWSRYILSFGLFGFAGGITNWFAIVMLFDDIPFLYGSGIIPKQFEEIKRTIAKIVMDTFFDPDFLQQQLTTRAKDLGNGEEIKKSVKEMLESQIFDEALEKKLNEIQEGKGMGGSIMKAFNIQGTTLKPTVKKIILSLASEFTTIFLKHFDSEAFFDRASVLKMRKHIESVIDDRLKDLTADKVKVLMEMIVRVHLGWLVVWGNVFGGIIGLLSTLAGY